MEYTVNCVLLAIGGLDLNRPS